MRAEIGLKVESSDGKDLGSIRNLIVDTDIKEVRSVVVEKGFLFKEDHEVPLDRLAERQNGRIRLNMTASEAEQLPLFDESRYVEAPSDVAAMFGHPAGGLMWAAPLPASGAFAPYPATMTPAATPVGGTIERDESPPDERARLFEQQNAVIGAGSEVYSSDGHKVGEIASVEFDSITGKPLMLRLRRGFLFTAEVDVPAEEVASMDDGRVDLKVDRERLEAYAADHALPIF